MKNQKIKLAGLLLLPLWTIFILYLQICEQKPINTLVLPLISLISIIYVTLRKPSKKSSILGKILIFGGMLALINIIINRGLNLATTRTLIYISAILTGMFLERVSPHKKLKDFMFLGIAAKIQFIATSALINLSETVQTNIYLTHWYIIPVLMVLGVPILAIKSLKIYRIIVLTITVFALLFTSHLLLNWVTHISIILGVPTGLWPLISTRIIGRKIFINEKKMLKNIKTNLNPLD